MYCLCRSLFKEVISTNTAPSAIGPYSQAIKSGNTLYISGQLGFDPKTMQLRKDIETQTDQVMQNLSAILKAGGSNWNNVLKTTILLKDINDFSKVNAIYGKYFKSDPPARATYAVNALPKDALVEIEAIAVVDEKQ